MSRRPVIHLCLKKNSTMYLYLATIAPNPAELLMDKRLDELVEQLKPHYDYIIADNVPLGIIADATIANRIADLTIFVVRAGKMDRRQLPELEELYQQKQLLILKKYLKL